MKTLDLHGLTYAEAETAVEKFINENWGNEEGIIITGNSTPMRVVVKNVLDFYKADYIVGNQLGTDKSYIKVDLS